MLVATAIFSIMMLLLMSLVSRSSAIWQQTDGDRQKRESARILLEMIGRDLEGAVIPPPGSLNSNLDFQLNPTVSGGNYLNPASSFWQTVIAGTGTTNGDIEDVGYFVNWAVIDGRAHGALCRLSIPASDPNSVFSNPMQPTRTWSQSLLNEYAPGLNVTSLGSPNAYKGLLAENVLGLWITLYNATNGVIGNAATPYDSRATTQRPAYADVTVVVLDPSVAERLSSVALITNCYAGPAQTNADTFITNLPEAGGYRAGAQAFTTRFQIQGGR